MSRNMQGTISGSRDALSMQKHTICEQECTGDNQ